MSSIASVTSTICRLMEVEIPKQSSFEPLKPVIAASKSLDLEGRIEKVLVYAPDAVGEWLYQEHEKLFAPIKALAPVELEMRAVLPTYTPVCFSSMFTGASPEVHGIRKYEKPILTCDTIFDALARAGKNVAIVAVKNSSVDLVFRNRRIDYYTEDYDPQVEARVLDLLDKRDYDLILAYHQEYDDLIHGSTPRDLKAIEAFRRHLRSFETLAKAFNSRYSSKDRVIAFTPDHGTHLDLASGKDAHGSDSPEDVEVHHFWGVYKARA